MGFLAHPFLKMEQILRTKLDNSSCCESFYFLRSSRTTGFLRVIFA